MLVQPAPTSQPIYRQVYQPAYAAPATTADPPLAPEIVPTSSVSSLPEMQASLSQLASAGPGARAAACLALVRSRTRAVLGPLTRLLQEASDPAVRESAARGLGLIADPVAQTALSHS